MSWSLNNNVHNTDHIFIVSTYLHRDFTGLTICITHSEEESQLTGVCGNLVVVATAQVHQKATRISQNEDNGSAGGCV